MIPTEDLEEIQDFLLSAFAMIPPLSQLSSSERYMFKSIDGAVYAVRRELQDRRAIASATKENSK